MFDTIEETLECPQCRATDVTLSATVVAFRSQRAFYHCAGCGQTFAGSWLDIAGIGQPEPPNETLAAEPAYAVVA